MPPLGDPSVTDNVIDTKHTVEACDEQAVRAHKVSGQEGRELMRNSFQLRLSILKRQGVEVRFSRIGHGQEFGRGIKYRGSEVS